MMSRGVGQHITTAAGSGTTVTGTGRRMVITVTAEVGGARPWLFLRFITTTSAGIRCHTATDAMTIIGDIVATGRIRDRLRAIRRRRLIQIPVLFHRDRLTVAAADDSRSIPYRRPLSLP